MENSLVNVAAQLVAAEEAVSKRDLNKVVAALIEAVRSLSDAAQNVAPVLEKKVPARKKPAAKTVAKAEPAKAATSKRTAPVIKPK